VFAAAIERASGFTRPLFLLAMKKNGSCVNGNGSLVVVNKDGWFVSSAHIFDVVQKSHEQAGQTSANEKRRVEIEADTSIHRKEKRRLLAKLNNESADALESFQYFWAARPGQIIDFAADDLQLYAPYDLAIGRLVSLPKGATGPYPVFREPSAVKVGSSVCRIGFPFVDQQVKIDSDNKLVDLTVGPHPIFPNEGIVTRIFHQIQGEKPDPNDPLWLETSTPGLRGQSGGPIIDTEARIVGIQSHTSHLSLGFDPINPGDGKPVHQFLNVGRATFVGTVVGLLKQRGIEFQIG